MTISDKYIKINMFKNLLTLGVYCVRIDKSHGEVSEWFKELVLKTSDAKAPRVRISASPPFFILIHFFKFGEVLKRPKRRPC